MAQFFLEVGVLTCRPFRLVERRSRHCSLLRLVSATTYMDNDYKLTELSNNNKLRW